MPWAARRRFFILLIVGAVAAAFLITVLIAIFSKTPSCSDGAQNQGETGIDCGGPCQYLCTEQEYPPIVLFTKALSNGANRTDVIASIENVNMSAAAKDVPYTIKLYGVGQVLIQEVTGVLDLPPHSTIPIFIPGISSGNQKIVNAFLDIASSTPKWFAMTADTRNIPVVSNTTRGGTESAPRIDAVLSNASVTALTGVQVIVVVNDDHGDVITASKTIVPVIPAQGFSTATFTWNSAFQRAPASIEVVPIIPLP